jgi:hypothetical protein
MDMGDRLRLLLVVDPAKVVADPPDDNRSGLSATVEYRLEEAERDGRTTDDEAGAKEDLP